MNRSTEHERRFVERLQELAERDDRAALAALRRGLGREPGEAAEMFPYVVPWVAADAPRWREDAYYLVAALFAWHPMNWPTEGGKQRVTNFGASFARLRAESDSGSIEHRFIALLNSHRDDLRHHLRHAVGLLRSKEIPVDWAQLLHEVQRWEWPDRPVQRAWARAFWGSEVEHSETGATAAGMTITS